MKIEHPYRCNGCQREKGVGNKWLIRIPDAICFVARDWDQELVDQEEDAEHYCGIGCLAKALSEWGAMRTGEKAV